VIAFDDAYASLGEGGNPATCCSSEGVTINGSYYGLVGGAGNGDPGNWSLEGTNGSAFLGCNEGSSCSPTFNLFSHVSEVSLDIGDSEVSQASPSQAIWMTPWSIPKRWTSTIRMSPLERGPPFL
jgi:hypothetical protein